jgi:parallel beta-helix repeat protein
MIVRKYLEAGVALAGLAAALAVGCRRGRYHALFAAPGSAAPIPAPHPCARSGRERGRRCRAAGPGAYPGGLGVTTSIRLIGQGAVIDGSSTSNAPGLQILASNTVVEGFTIEHASLEGILVGNSPANGDGSAASGGSAIHGVTIQDDVVTGNDTGFSGVVGVGFGECFTTPFAPGDCGEAIHLVSATDSVVRDNLVSGNAGGILLTDEFGPATRNVIEANRSIDNDDDCGITLASHTPPRASSPTWSRATSPTGTALPVRAAAS